MSANFPGDNTHNQPGNPGEFKFAPETILSPAEMVTVTEQLLTGFEVEFPELGAIPVEINTSSKTGLPKDGFECGSKGQKIYTPGVEPRAFYNSTEPGDYATRLMECFGKTVTIRARAVNGLPEPADLQHKKVPRIVRGLLDPSLDENAKAELRVGLTNVIAHNTGLPVKDNPCIETLDNAYDWMLGRLRAAMAPSAEAA